MNDEQPLVDQHGRAQSVAIEGWGEKIGLTGPNAFPWFVIVVMMLGIGYLVSFNLKSWGEPIPIRDAFKDVTDTIDRHTLRMSLDHGDMLLAQRWNTFVQWACSPNNTNPEAKKKCTRIDLMEPQPEDQSRRRYRLPTND